MPRNCPTIIDPASIQALCDCITAGSLAGIEQGIAPLGCVKNSGVVTGQVFLVRTIGEDGAGATNDLLLVDTSGVITFPYLGGWEPCGTNIRRRLSDETVSTPGGLIVPVGANYAEIYVNDGNIYWNTAGGVVVYPSCARSNDGARIELECADELVGFRWNVMSGTPVLYVEYFSLP